MVHSALRLRNKKTNVPSNSAYLTMGFCLVLCFFDFGVILRLTNTASAASLLVEMLAVLKLRVYKPDLNRPYRVPIDYTRGLFLFLLPCLLVNLLFLIISFATSPWIMFAFILLTGFSILLSRRIASARSTVSTGDRARFARLSDVEDAL